MPASTMPSPMSSRSVSPESQMGTPISFIKESARHSPARSLPPSPYPLKTAMKTPTTRSSPCPTRPAPERTLSMVQITRPSNRSCLKINIFSLLRGLLIGAGVAGIALAVIEARKGEDLFLQSIALKLVFLSFSTLLAILDLVQFYICKLPYRVEAVLDLLLAVGFLSFFVIGVLVHKWTTDIIYFVLCVIHLLSFFNVLIRAHKISLQLQHLSKLNLRDVERGEKIANKSPKSPKGGLSSPEFQSARSKSVASRMSKRSKTSAKTITAVRNPCAELEGSHRWTIVSEKRIRLDDGSC